MPVSPPEPNTSSEPDISPLLARSGCNIAERLADAARRYPTKPAVIHETGADAPHTITFEQLEQTAGGYARGFQRVGIARGDRTIVLVRPGVDFFAVTFALFKIGAVPVLIDPGMPRDRLIDCLAGVEAAAFVGVPRAHLARLLYRHRFRSLRTLVTVGRRWGWGGRSLADLNEQPSIPFPAAAAGPDETAAILFTSGSTGAPKGVVYTHATFDAQVRCLSEVFGYGPDDVDLATFPLFALFDAALGMTAAIPDMDATRPGFVDSDNILHAIRAHECSHMFASPALLDRVGRHCAEHGERIEPLRRVITAGAPVAPGNLARFRAALPDDARIFTPYGATEALPVASIESREILEETAADTADGGGVCVGRPLPGIDLRIIPISDDAIESMAGVPALPCGEIGEICVRGPVVTRAYLHNDEATARAKIAGDDGQVWHRMGDVGRLDDKGRLWMCGRAAHRVESRQGPLFTIPVEQILNGHPQVRRTALVGVGARGRQRPVICVEVEPGAGEVDEPKLLAELRANAAAHALTRGIDDFLVHPGFPVDVRHNAKIFREQLADWAAGRLA